MFIRSFRTLFLSSVLLCLLAVSGVLTVQATPSSMHLRHSFSPDGHGIAIPQVVDTATTPQVRRTSLTSMSLPSTTPSRLIREPASHPLPAPQNVVVVPPASGIAHSAKEGLSRQYFKPDANGAGGLDNYLETVNEELAIYNRRGTQEYTTTFQNWFGINGGLYDPVTMWDNSGSRFLFSGLQSSANNIWLSVAQQTDAMGKFCNYSFPTLSGDDFDKLGVDSDGIYFSVNVLSHTGQVVNNELFFANRTALENCQQASYSYWTGLTNPDGSIAQAITPARQDSSAGGVEYLVNSYPSGACQLTLWKLTSSAMLTNTSVATQCYSPSPKAKQKGSSALIDTGDCSVTQASYINGLLTLDTLGSYDWGDGNGPVGIVEWYVLNPGAASVASQGAFGTPGDWLFYPSTIKTPDGKMLFVYNVSGPDLYPSVWFVSQTLTDTKALANGTSYYYYGNSGLAPWGDYQSAWPDASGSAPNAVWITGEYSKLPSVWGTKFDLVTP